MSHCRRRYQMDISSVCDKQTENQEPFQQLEITVKVKLIRAQGGCLGTKSRRRT